GGAAPLTPPNNCHHPWPVKGAAATRRNNRTKFTILSRFFSKNESSLAILFYSFIKILAPEILPP
ncbi:hypothetical protein M8U55_15735, partial [Enterobacter hormaechei]|nr:hypothetical protein [Enterobacter hormaechei]